MEPLNRGQLSSSLDLESGTLTEELVASATINGVSATVPVTVCPHARVACGFRSDGVESVIKLTDSILEGKEEEES